MESKKWVQHISGQGRKWEVKCCSYNDMDQSDICVYNPDDPKGISRNHFLPKSEYILCDPPEIWEKVEVGIRGSQSGVLYLKDAPHILNFANLGEGFRWVESGDGLTVKRKKS